MRKSGTRKLLRPPYRRITLTAGFVLLVYIILMLFSGGFASGNDQVGLDMLLCMMASVFWLFFFVQFALPLRRLTDRFEAFYRLVFHILGAAGPALRIENGHVRERKDESSRNGPGVIVLDTASAAVIRSPAEFRQAVGPGVAFTNRFDSLAGVVDLHLTRAQIGPQESENPFDPQGPDESEAAYKARQDRRYLTQGLTRDGIEVCPRISVAVKIDAELGEGNSGFGYNPESVIRAIKGRPIDMNAPPETQSREVDITWLPLRLAADIWKECLSRVTLEELFSFTPGETTALQRTVGEMRARLTKPEYDETDIFGRPTGNKRPSREYEILVRRGLKVNTTNVTFLKLPESVEKRLVELWMSTWLIRARRENDYVLRQRSYEASLAKRHALILFTRRVSHFLGGQSRAVRLGGEQILRHLIRGTLSLTAQESRLHRVATDEIDQLKELLEWSEERSEP